jgi:nicotinate-nucleotide--dimethylbenzimidazole phosphoribosyltransferase
VIYSHRSAERGRGRMLEYLDAETYLALDMRLGEGTGAALVINVIETGLAVYREMATLTAAGVAT